MVRYLPRKARGLVEANTTSDGHAVIDFWSYLCGKIGYLSIFDRELSKRYLARVKSTMAVQAQLPTPSLHPLPEIQIHWDEILDEMRSINEDAGLKGLPKPFSLGQPPSVAEKRLVAENEHSFELFCIKAHIYLVEQHRHGIESLPQELKDGKLAIHEVRLLRNYVSHPKKDKSTVKHAAEICKKYMGTPRWPKDASEFRQFQVKLLSEMKAWCTHVAQWMSDELH
jgi:hypothetical protein